MGPEQAKALHARYSKRAQPFGLTLEELDFKNFPVHNVYPGIPVMAWLRFPNCAELVEGGGVLLDGEGRRGQMEGRTPDLPHMGLGVRGHPPRRGKQQEPRRARKT